MKKLSIKLPASKQRDYQIFIGVNVIDKIATLIDFTKYSKLFIITDQRVETLYLEKLKKHLPAQTVHLALPPGEQAKDITHLTNIWKTMIAKHLDRKSLVINLGGGVIGDIGGFAASTYMRGIDFINIPTTLLAQVDESVGGKTMIDFAGIKNIVGTFYQPAAVAIDIATLETLPRREFLSGFGEIIKCGLIKDKKFFETVTNKKPEDFSQKELTNIITKSCEIKAAIVQADETESDMRKLINFGHTIGHAVEALSLETNKPLLHGEAVSIGMVAESHLAGEIGLLKDEAIKTIREKLDASGLPTKIPDFPIDAMIEKMKSDKKNVGGAINFTLLTAIGEGVINQTASEATIRKVLATA